MCIFNQGYDFLLQLLIFEQHDMPFKDGFFFFTERFTSFGFDRFQLRRCLGTTAQKTFNFLINLVGRNFFRSMTISSSFSSNALPKAIPGDAKMPEIITLPYL